jgi:hypothetical protein
MFVYVITQQENLSDEIDTPILECGVDRNESALPVFTSEERAKQYINEANWDADQQVAELSTLEAAKLLLVAGDNEVSHLVIDPERQSHLSGVPQSVVPLDDTLQAHTELLTELVNA